MAYLGAVQNADFMSVGDDVFVFICGRWVRYCAALEWFSTLPGRIIRKLWYKGFNLRLNAA